ncbi:MAG TPA: NB-ARC domain-containing protein, partial [Ktedonobacteraceae bacterium]|nr:NB-ARC domain-containing protein [Ktedonobacteraceae bacterium]
DADASVHQQTSNEPPVIPASALSQSTPVHVAAPGQFWKVPPILLPLVGRTRELEEIKNLLTTVRLLTLVGAGGVGKTRFSFQLACEMRSLFPDGVCFVSLTAASAPEQVMSLIARDLELQNEIGPPYQRVEGWLREKALLLVLDNFEQVSQAAPELERLLVSCPSVKILVTSRAVLHLASEYQYRLLPLAVPNLKAHPDSITVAQSPSVQLFVQRARMHLPTFHVTESNAATLAKICVRLDGLPLAIELAAARINLFSPHALLPRLSRSLDVLTKGLPALPRRQQTLRNTLAWSYSLLDADTQRWFRLLSLFVGGFTVEAAEALFAAVMGAGTSNLPSALDGLDALIDHSLLQSALPMDEGGEARLQMLETIREFGRERLLESDESADAHEAHATYYLKLAEEAAQDLQGPQQGQWLARLDQEHGNLQAAMEWMLVPENLASAQEKDADKRVMTLRLINALRQFWIARGYLNEGLQYIEQVLQRYAEVQAEATLLLARVYLFAASLCTRLGKLGRAEILVEQGIACASVLEDKAPLAEAFRVAGWVAHRRGLGERAFDCYERSLTLFKDLDDLKGITATMLNMAFLLETRGDFKQAGILFEEVLARQRALHNTMGIYGAIYQLVHVLFAAEEHSPLPRIHALLQEGLALAQEAGDRHVTAGLQGLLGWVVLSEGKLAQARELVEECLRFFREEDREIYGQYLVTLGEILTAQGDEAAAQSVFEQSLAVGKELGDKTEVIAVTLEGMAGLALVQGHYAWAVRLWAKAGWRREEIGVLMLPRERPARERSLDQLRTLLGEQAFTDLWEEGRTLSLEEVWFARLEAISPLLNGYVTTRLLEA